VPPQCLKVLSSIDNNRARVRFMRNSNFWIEEGATWVPTFEELYLMNDALHATNYFNLNNKTLHKANSSSETCDCGHL
jgi:hypothetical protein